MPLIIEVPETLSPNHGRLRILTANGDDRVIWDRDSLAEVEKAREQFDHYAKLNYKAYTVNSKGEKGHVIEIFDPSVDEIIMVPDTFPG